MLALDGKRMENGRQLRINLYARGVNDTVVLDVLRGDRKLSLRVPVGERDSDAGRLSDLVAQQVPVRALGVLALNLTPADRRSCCPTCAASEASSWPASRM